jgi:hypothetical protein
MEETYMTQRSTHTVSINGEMLTRMTHRYANGSDFHLIDNENGGFDLLRNYPSGDGDDRLVCFFSELPLEAVIAILCYSDSMIWELVDELLGNESLEGYEYQPETADKPTETEVEAELEKEFANNPALRASMASVAHAINQNPDLRAKMASQGLIFGELPKDQPNNNQAL